MTTETELNEEIMLVNVHRGCIEEMIRDVEVSTTMWYSKYKNQNADLQVQLPEYRAHLYTNGRGSGSSDVTVSRDVPNLSAVSPTVMVQLALFKALFNDEEVQDVEQENTMGLVCK